MKFHTGDIILTKTNIPTPPACPVIARSVKPAQSAPPALIRLVSALVIALAIFIGRLVPRPLPRWPTFKPQFALLSIIAMALIEVLAQGYLERSLGVMAA